MEITLSTFFDDKWLALTILESQVFNLTPYELFALFRHHRATVQGLFEYGTQVILQISIKLNDNRIVWMLCSTWYDAKSPSVVYSTVFPEE